MCMAFAENSIDFQQLSVLMLLYSSHNIRHVLIVYDSLCLRVHVCVCMCVQGYTLHVLLT